MAHLAADSVDRQVLCLGKLIYAVTVRQYHRLMAGAFALSKRQLPARLRGGEGVNLGLIIHPQALRDRQRQRGGGELSRAEPAACRVLNAAAAGIHPGSGLNRLGIHRHGHFRRKLQAKHLGNLLLALLVPAKLGDAAPVTIELKRQGIVEPAGEGKGSGEKAGQGRVVGAQQRVERSLAIAGCTLSGCVIGAVERHLPAPAQQGE